MFVEEVLFVAFPYLAVALAVVVTSYRYFTDRFSYSTQSSQFLENRALFWGSVPWHYGILVILLAHVVAFLFQGAWASIVAHRTTLYVLELIGLALAGAAFLGLSVLLTRRIVTARIFAVTSVMDWVLLVALLTQVALGFWTALIFRWGSDWFLFTVAPWLESLITFEPDTSFVVNLPWVIKLHILGGFAIIAIFPFTRLVHVVTVPITYLWRPYQVVIWNRRARRQR